MDTNWIEKAFEKAEGMNLDPLKRQYLDKAPAILLSFMMAYGPDASKKVMDALLGNEDLVRFVCLTYCCGCVDGDDRSVKQ